jgi:protein-S-isoprenylcysteine O-methyltransferase Ste14
MSRYVKWAQKEHGAGVYVAAMIPAGILFLILLPLVVVWVGPYLDSLLGLPSINVGAINYLIGGLLVIVGMYFGLWSNFVQFTRGRGTPLPVLPTQELLTKGPYRYCRNPMTFGTILAYLGLGVMAGTIAGIGLVLVFAACLILYLKRMEERELAERFGEAYLQYRQEVPFIIPRIPRRY